MPNKFKNIYQLSNHPPSRKKTYNLFCYGKQYTLEVDLDREIILRLKPKFVCTIRNILGRCFATYFKFTYL